MNSGLTGKDFELMSDEEQKKYIDMMMDQPMLQGLVMAPMPDPSGGMMNMGIPGFMSAINAVWIDDSLWKCICGIENSGKFCTECGRAAPLKEWICPRCGITGNTGNYCGECGCRRPDAPGTL